MPQTPRKGHKECNTLGQGPNGVWTWPKPTLIKLHQKSNHIYKIEYNIKPLPSPSLYSMFFIVLSPLLAQSLVQLLLLLKIGPSHLTVCSLDILCFN